MPRPLTLDRLRHYAVSRSLFRPTSLKRAIAKLGFVQADPIRAPARAQDLTLRLRVRGYRAGDLERRYAELGVAEDFFVNYGFVTLDLQALMHPRSGHAAWEGERERQAEALLEYVRARRSVHPREVDEHFGHGRAMNAWGGSSNATTRLLDALHYRGDLRVVRRDAGVRRYAAHRREPGARPSGDPQAGAPEQRSTSEDASSIAARIDALVDAIVHLYAPLPAPSLSGLVARLRHAVPQWRAELPAALQRAKRRLAHGRVDAVDWYWPVHEEPTGAPRYDDELRLLTPFDPIVWDRRRFELFWHWRYRFEAYTPAARRRLGYYALPLLWRGSVIGWGNLAVARGALEASFGYATGKAPSDAAYASALEAELERCAQFLGID